LNATQFSGGIGRLFILIAPEFNPKVNHQTHAFVGLARLPCPFGGERSVLATESVARFEYLRRPGPETNGYAPFCA
jgi:hypothetical protein